MNCRTFELQVADWLSGRLPESISAQMAAHKATCRPCAEIADAEADMRRQWSEYRTPNVSADLWPRIEARLDQPSFRKAARPSFNASYRWAAAVCAMAILVPVAVTLSEKVSPPVGGQKNVAQIVTPQVTPRPQLASSPGLAFSLIGDAGQGDPSIDDPIGGTMEHVWTQVATDNKVTVSH